jgi:hypothetical protein
VGVLTLDTRQQLLALLGAMPAFEKDGGRDLLLAGLPAKLVGDIKRSPAKTADLAAIVEACELWRSDPTEGANYPTRLLVQTATALAEGSATGTDLAALLAALPLTPPTGPGSVARSADIRILTRCGRSEARDLWARRPSRRPGR